MPDFTRRADVTWNGDLFEGAGTLALGTGVLQDAPISWRARTEGPEAATSPEELIAAAHASCYAMAFSNTLAQAGHAPEQLQVTAEITGSLSSEGLKLARSVLTVRGRVAGLDQAAFEEFARQGEENCPVSNALRGNLDITVNATLES
jgi:osmotically inducible protein OsmC